MILYNIIESERERERDHFVIHCNPGPARPMRESLRSRRNLRWTTKRRHKSCSKHIGHFSQAGQCYELCCDSHFDELIPSDPFWPFGGLKGLMALERKRIMMRLTSILLLSLREKKIQLRSPSSKHVLLSFKPVRVAPRC